MAVYPSWSLDILSPNAKIVQNVVTDSDHGVTGGKGPPILEDFLKK